MQEMAEDSQELQLQHNVPRLVPSWRTQRKSCVRYCVWSIPCVRGVLVDGRQHVVVVLHVVVYVLAFYVEHVDEYLGRTPGTGKGRRWRGGRGEQEYPEGLHERARYGLFGHKSRFSEQDHRLGVDIRDSCAQAGIILSIREHRHHLYSSCVLYLNVSENEISLSREVRLVEGVLPSAVPQVQHHISKEPFGRESQNRSKRDTKHQAGNMIKLGQGRYGVGRTKRVTDNQTGSRGSE